MTEQAQKLWTNVLGENFIEDMKEFLEQRLQDEKAAAEAKYNEAVEALKDTNIAVAPVTPRPVEIWFQFTTHADRAIIIAVGKDFARVKSTATAGEKKICFNHVVEYRDVSGKEV